MHLGICELMQPIAVGYSLNEEKFPRVADWMKRVKKETQPYFDQTHLILLRLRNEKSKL